MSPSNPQYSSTVRVPVLQRLAAVVTAARLPRGPLPLLTDDLPLAPGLPLPLPLAGKEGETVVAAARSRGRLLVGTAAVVVVLAAGSVVVVVVGTVAVCK